METCAHPAGGVARQLDLRPAAEAIAHPFTVAIPDAAAAAAGSSDPMARWCTPLRASAPRKGSSARKKASAERPTEIAGTFLSPQEKSSRGSPKSFSKMAALVPARRRRGPRRIIQVRSCCSSLNPRRGASNYAADGRGGLPAARHRSRDGVPSW